MDNIELNNEQKAILEHTIKNNMYCGNSEDMEILCANGLMEFAGTKTFVPDPYFRITPKGKDILK